MKIGLEYIIPEKHLTGINRLIKGTVTAVLEMDKGNQYYSIDQNYLGFLLPGAYGEHIDFVETGVQKSPFELSPEMTNLFRLRAYCSDIDLLHSYFRPFHDLHCKCPKILTIYDLTQSLHPEWVAGKEFFDTCIWESARQADKIITISEYTKQDVVDYFGITEEKIVVIYPGLEQNLNFNKVNKELLQPQTLEDGFVLSVSSSASPHKNLRGTIKGFIQFKKAHPTCRVKLVVAGPGVDRASIGIEGDEVLYNEVVFTGYVSDSTLATLYKYALGVIFVSFCEGFGLPVLEALAAGKAVITSEVTSLPEVGGDAVIYCDPYDTESIAQAIHILVFDEQVRKECEKRSLGQASKFSYQRAAKETLELYKQFV